MKKIILGLLLALLHTPAQSAQITGAADAALAIIGALGSVSLIKNGAAAYSDGNKTETFGSTLYALGKKQSDPMSAAAGQFLKLVGSNSKIQGVMSVLLGSAILVWIGAVVHNTIQGDPCMQAYLQEDLEKENLEVETRKATTDTDNA